MSWDILYKQNHQPTLKEVSGYINNKLWEDLNFFLQETYKTEPKLSYSQCSMQRGWNVKYRKNGKSLCTLYPMEGYFIALVVIGYKERFEAELRLPLFSKYTQDLYHSSGDSTGCRWMMIDVTEQAILNDLISLVEIRAKAK